MQPVLEHPPHRGVGLGIWQISMLNRFETLQLYRLQWKIQTLGHGLLLG